MAKPVIGGRRSAIEILHEMLSVCGDGGVNKTAIMYLSNLSYDQLIRYLGFLSSHGLIRRDQETNHFQLTARGRETLEQMAGVIGLLRELQQGETVRPDKTAVKAG